MVIRFGPNDLTKRQEGSFGPHLNGNYILDYATSDTDYT